MVMFRFLSCFLMFLLLVVSCGGKKQNHASTEPEEAVNLKGHIVGKVEPSLPFSILIDGEFVYEMISDKNGRFQIKIPDKYCQKKNSDVIIVFTDKEKRKFLQKRFHSPLNCSKVLNLGPLELMPLGQTKINVSINNRFKKYPNHAKVTVVGWKDESKTDADGDVILSLPVGTWDINIVSEGYDPVLLKEMVIKLPDIPLTHIMLESSLKMSGIPTINNNVGYYWGFSVVVGVSNAINAKYYRVVQERDVLEERRYYGENKWHYIQYDYEYRFSYGIDEKNKLLFYFADEEGNISKPVSVFSHVLFEFAYPKLDGTWSNITNPSFRLNGFLEKDFGSVIEFYSDYGCKNKISEKMIENEDEKFNNFYYKETKKRVEAWVKLLNKSNNSSYCFPDSIFDYTLDLNYFYVWPLESGKVFKVNDFRPEWNGQADDKNFYYSLKLCKDTGCSQGCEEERSPVKSGEKITLSKKIEEEKYICVKVNGAEGTTWVSSDYPASFSL